MLGVVTGQCRSAVNMHLYSYYIDVNPLSPLTSFYHPAVLKAIPADFLLKKNKQKKASTKPENETESASVSSGQHNQEIPI